MCVCLREVLTAINYFKKKGSLYTLMKDTSFKVTQFHSLYPGVTFPFPPSANQDTRRLKLIE